MLNVPLGEKVQDRRPPLAHRRQAALEGRRQLARALHPLTIAVHGLRHLLEAWRGRQLAEREASACLRGARGMDGEHAELHRLPLLVVEDPAQARQTVAALNKEAAQRLAKDVRT